VWEHEGCGEWVNGFRGRFSFVRCRSRTAMYDGWPGYQLDAHRRCEEANVEGRKWLIACSTGAQCEVKPSRRRLRRATSAAEGES
jgi:hypothetical protein